MEWMHETRLRLRSLLKSRQLQRDLEDEIQFHLEMRAARNREAGMEPREAVFAARRRFGGTTRWKEKIRALWRINMIENVLQDLRYGARSMWKTPGFALATVLLLAIGIGSTTAIFSMVNAVLLRSLPFAQPDRLVLLWGNVQRQKVERRGNSYPDYLDWKAQSQSISGMSACDNASFTLPGTGSDQAERITGEWVSAGYFEILGVNPIAGRTIRNDEDSSRAGTPVVLISEGLWKRRFGSDAGILGKPLELNQRQFTVIGIVPAWFRGITDNADIWAPFTASSSAASLADRGSRGSPAVARLKAGVSVKQAQTELDGISKRLERAYPDTNAGRAVEVAPLETEMVGDLRTPLVILLGAVVLVLLIACANVANLLLARSETRRQEIAVRLALGAGRNRLLSQLLTESMLLACTGAVLGLLLANWAVKLLIRSSPITLPSFVNPHLDWTVAIFTVLVSLTVGILVGVAPGLQAGQRDVHSAIKESRSGADVARQRFRSALVISEVSVAMILLVAAGLLLRSFLHLSAVNPGFDPRDVLTLTMALPRGQSPGSVPAQPTAVQRTLVNGRQLLERVRAIPSVTSASVASDFPLSDDFSAFFYSAEGQPIVGAQSRPRAYLHRVSPDFFKSLRAPLVAGRTFNDTEMEGKGDVAIVSESLVKRFWAGQDPIGKRIRPGGPDASTPWWTIVGVVGDMKYRGIPNNPTSDPDVFVPFSDRQRTVAMLVRSSLDSAQIASAVRAAIHEFDPSIPVYEVATMSDRLKRALERSRFSSWMMGIFAAIALILASIGLYGLMSYTVRQRTREFGVRIALGANAGDVTRLVIRKGMLLVGAGIGIGVLLAVACARALGSLLFEVGQTDPATFAGVALVLIVVALAACYLPARRASRIDPITALRYE